ncbi:L-threonine dehydratase catabolic TdcB [Pseudolycoriella hygida]|uniref:L-serine deaminase n=1 Tax=Pseudolycoriella hygida TaxID=35572 RepID=A0A9Q0RVZ4_9DIPT|nr:L-threonine dehydratase catabolic TdcB [Pseudolycoriella hygida]
MAQYEIEDIYCIPHQPVTISFNEVEKAAAVVRKSIDPTPCTKSKSSDIFGITLFFKKEFLQHTGSFKERGARYALSMLSADQKQKGVVAASLGNHSQGISYHAKLMKIPCIVVMPNNAPYNKIVKCRNYGANVIIHGNDIAESRLFAIDIAKEKEMTYINGYDHPHIIAGQGTTALEILEQVEDIDAIIVPVGGGGLIAGVAVAAKTLRKDIKIVGVETESCPSFSNALRKGGPVFTPGSPTIADGLAVPTVGYNAYATVRPLLDKMIVVNEEWIAPSMLHLVETEKCVVEGAGSAGLAAVISGQLDEFKDKRVVVILCGGNIDTNIFGRCLERGLITVGRLFRFSVIAPNKPGSIAALCSLTSSAGVSVVEIVQERLFMKDIHHIKLKLICETRDWDHAEKFKKVVRKHYESATFDDLALCDNISSRVPL